MRRCWGLLTVFAVACGSSSPPPPSSPPPGTDNGTSITGRERIGWDQQADDAAGLAGIRYFMYVDNVRNAMTDASCGATPGSSGFPCSGKLPPMSNGIHTLEMASAYLDGGESARSAALRVTVTGAEPEGGAAASPLSERHASSAAPPEAERLATGVAGAVDAAFLPDGRLLIAERTGGVHVFSNGRFAAQDSLPPGITGTLTALLSIAVDPAFTRTRRVYIAGLAPGADGPLVQIARYTELAGQLGQRAVVFQEPVATAEGAAAVLRFGPDGNLYLALDGTTSSGELLRFTPEGAVPRDGAGSLPAIARGIARLRGFAWAPSGLAWIADEAANGSSLTSLGLTPPPIRARVRTRDPIEGPIASLAFAASSTATSAQGEALIASPEGYILRIRFTEGESPHVAATEQLLDGRFGPIRIVAVGPDGFVYFCTDDALGRLALQ